MKDIEAAGIARLLSMQFTERDIARSAILLTQRYGSSALERAKQRHRELVKADNATGAEVWQRIIDALQRAQGPIH